MCDIDNLTAPINSSTLPGSDTDGASWNKDIFIEKFISCCRQKNESPKKVSENIGVSRSAITGWKKGIVPNGNILVKLAYYLGVTIQYLITDDEVIIRPSDKKLVEYGLFRSLYSIPQRFLSLRHGDPLTSDELTRISECVNCNIQDLYVKTDYDKMPKTAKSTAHGLTILETLELLNGIMDRCADTRALEVFQIQLSRIILHRIDEYFGIEHALLQEGHLLPSYPSKKLMYLYYGIKSNDCMNAYDYGLNFTDLDVIREGEGISFIYMFTGKTYEELFNENDAIISKYIQLLNEKDARIAQLEARIKELENK